MNEVIKTILEQIEWRKLSTMVGAHMASYDNNNNAFGFRFKMCKKANHCKIQYNYGTDTYTMTFNKIGRYDFKQVGEFTGVHNDMMNDIFEDFTGLATKLF